MIEGRVRCTLRYAPNVVKTPQSPSCPVVTVQSTVAIATADEAGEPGQQPGTRRPMRGAIFAPLIIYPEEKLSPLPPDVSPNGAFL